MFQNGLCVCVYSDAEEDLRFRTVMFKPRWCVTVKEPRPVGHLSLVIQHTECVNAQAALTESAQDIGLFTHARLQTLFQLARVCFS